MPAGGCIISGMSRYVIRGPLTYELALKDSPIRQFFDDRLIPGLKDAQAAYRKAAGPLILPGVPREATDAGTIGTAADWIMRFLVHPNPSLRLAAQGASLCGMLPALEELALMLGFRDSGAAKFTGPARGSGAEPDLLYRACLGPGIADRGLPPRSGHRRDRAHRQAPGQIGEVAAGYRAGCWTAAARCRYTAGSTPADPYTWGRTRSWRPCQRPPRRRPVQVPFRVGRGRARHPGLVQSPRDPPRVDPRQSPKLTPKASQRWSTF
jgi:hypothetical protein